MNYEYKENLLKVLTSWSG